MSTMSEVAFLLGGANVKVLTTSGRGFTPEEVAELPEPIEPLEQ